MNVHLSPCWLPGPTDLADRMGVPLLPYFSICMFLKLSRQSLSIRKPTLLKSEGPAALIPALLPSPTPNKQTLRLTIGNCYLYDPPNLWFFFISVSWVEGKLATGPFFSRQIFGWLCRNVLVAILPLPSKRLPAWPFMYSQVCPAVSQKGPRNSKAISVLSRKGIKTNTLALSPRFCSLRLSNLGKHYSRATPLEESMSWGGHISLERNQLKISLKG